jgi:mRNA-decapping enzyme subunit 2
MMRPTSDGRIVVFTAPPSSSPSSSSSGHSLTLPEVLEALFLKYMPGKHNEDFSERIFFTLEEMFWCYLDHYRALDPSLPNMKISAFAKAFFQHFPFLSTISTDLGDLEKKFWKYKSHVSL